ncbi:hypothetical protein NC796_04280 [Aliifodinibius sp. S!AR15-10]|uniref:hypothetical protein n=1 Tax=Aliifodinibius sp. S!AR15-10 TaxID=2950437 RepID=UPI00285F50E4|nr:hypothetical protein [Aliifodinibius sp. S!AR15-10]MDR8390346.1 hypothetical protein [Aliifodinibius sp. S!AR15-10]
MHSLLFFLIGICTLYVLYTVAFDQITTITWIAFSIVLAELIILVWNDWQCPLTIFAENSGAVRGSVADLYLPGWLADHLFKIFGLLFIVICLMLAWRIFW